MGVLAGQFYELRCHQKSFKIIFWTFNFTFRNLISLIPFDCWGKTYQIHCVFQRMPLYLAIFITLKISIYNKQVSFSISLQGSRLHFPFWWHRWHLPPILSPLLLSSFFISIQFCICGMHLLWILKCALLSF